jgi:hypothetical protein
LNIIKKQVEIIVRYDQEGIPTPIKFKWVDMDESKLIIVVDKIRHKELISNRHSKLHYYVFLCESCINDLVIEYELRYEVGELRWILYRM